MANALSARHAAMRKLIDSHTVEYHTFLVQERAKAGLQPVPLDAFLGLSDSEKAAAYRAAAEALDNKNGNQRKRS